KMNPRGEAWDVKLPQKLKDRLQAKKEGEQSLITEDGIVRLVRGSTFLLPKKPIAVGDGWDLEPYTFQESGFWITARSRINYDGPVEEDGRKLLKFTRSSEYDIRRPTDAKEGPETTIKRQKGEGTILLDAATRRLVKSEMAESMATETVSADP